MSDKEAQHREENCEDGNTKLVLWRLGELERKLAERDAEIFKRLAAVERWQYTLMGMGVIAGWIADCLFKK
jgi:hypothetical protein